jgi:Cu(I)/Ag(I) efflux system membrane protein CusA/SilA
MKRIAAPMVGGVLSAMLLTLVVIPAFYAIWRWYADVKRTAAAGQVQPAVVVPGEIHHAS